MADAREGVMKLVAYTGLALLFVLLAFTIAFSGCVSSDQGQAPSGNHSWRGGRPGNFTGGRFGNLTDEQRQQMFNQLAAACQGKAAGDACEMQTPRGNMTGTCETRNETLVCSAGFGGNRTGPPNG